MASTTIQARFRLAPHARALLYVAALLARIGLPIPHAWVVAVTNRSWSLNIGNGNWKRIQIDRRGRVQ